jgi:membrane protease YdiL (CAAX protease family)
METPTPLTTRLRTGFLVGLLAIAGGLFGFGVSGLSDGQFLPAVSDLPIFAVLFGVGLVIGVLMTFVIGKNNDDTREPQAMSPYQFVLAALVSSGFMAGLALLIDSQAGFGLIEQLIPTWEGVALGIALTLPMVAMLMVIMAAPLPFLERFRDQQIADFVKKGVDFGWVPIILISFGAGFGEELLFRGVLQTWLSEQVGLLLGVAVASVFFGVVHGPRPGYILVSTLIGVYLGTAYALTGSLLAVATAHFLYDIYALRVTVLAVRKAR